MAKAPGAVKIDGLSADIQVERLEALRQVVPEAFSEGQLDVDKLKTLFSKDVRAGDEEGERFRLEWAGKHKVFDEIAKRTSCTLTLDSDRSSKDFEESKNVFIEGENLEVLRALQKAYFGKVKMIYIDPPYNTGKDFVYNDNFRQTEAEYCEDTCNVDENGNLKRAYKQNTKDSGKYHSNWLSMMYPRLYLARNLLKEDGVIFVSIDDNEVHNLRALMNEIFGEENFSSQLIWNKQHSQQQGIFKVYHEYVLVYFKDSGNTKNIEGGEGEIVAGALKKISRSNPASEFEFPAGTRVDTSESLEFSGTYGESEKVTVVRGRFLARGGRLAENVVLSAGWTQKDQMISWFSGCETIDTKGQKVLEFYFNSEGKLKCRKDRSKITPPTILPQFGMVSEQTGTLTRLMGGTFFDNPKPVEMIRLFTEWFVKGDEIVLDLFAGSGTTAHAVMGQNAEDGENRRYVCVQMPEETPDDSEARKAGFVKISDIAIERIKRAAAKIREEKPDTKADLGVQVYRVTDSNFPQWHARSFESDTELEDSLFAHVGRQAEGSERARATEVLLKIGYDLNTLIEERDGFLLADQSVALVLRDDFDPKGLLSVLESKPKMVIVLERIFKDDDSKINFALRCKEEKVTFQTV